jgi:uncharacterized protein YjbI with pentapeptide repeats
MSDQPFNWQRFSKIVAISICVILAFTVFLWVYLLFTKGNVWPEWTGFGDYMGPLTKDQRGKTLWDWLELLIVPAVLALGALFFNHQERKNELLIADRQNQEMVLQKYFDKINDLILEKQLMKVKYLRDEKLLPTGVNEDLWPSETELEESLPPKLRAVRNMAQVRTVTVLRQLDIYHRNIVIQFLRDTGLGSFVLVNASLANANLAKTDLKYLNLDLAKLENTNLEEANLIGAGLNGADLKQAKLKRANLTLASLNNSNLSKADLTQANLSRAHLKDATLIGATLIRANLTYAILTRALLRNADLHKADLRHVNLSKAELEKANLSGSNLCEATMIRAGLAEADLRRTNLTYAILTEAYLFKAKLMGADLRWANLSESHIGETNLRGAKVFEEQLSKVSHNLDAIKPDGTKYG